MRKLFLVVGLMWFVGLGFGQNNSNPTATVGSDPAGACTSPLQMQYNSTNGNLWGCKNSVWTLVSGGGGGGSIGAAGTPQASNGSGAFQAAVAANINALNIGSVGAVNVKDPTYGAKGDGVQLLDVSMGAIQTYAFTTASSFVSGALAEYKGINTSSPIDATATNSGTSTTSTSAAITTGSNNEIVVTFFGGADNNTFVAPTPPPTARQFQAGNVALYFSWIGDLTKATAGATTPVTASQSVGSWNAVTIGLVPSGTSAYVGGSAAQISGGTLTLSAAGSSQVNDIQIACIQYQFGSSVTPPAGWTSFVSSSVASNNTVTCYRHLVASAPSAVMTSSSATFTSGDVGKIECIDGTSASGLETCGTISAFTDANNVQVTNGNQNAGAISSKEAVYATDDATAINNAVAASCGKRVYFPAGLYGNSGTTIAPCTNGGISIMGDSAGLDWWPTAATATTLHGTSSLYYLTTGMGSNSGLHIGSSSSTGESCKWFYNLQNINLIGGLGNQKGGGGSSSPGILLDRICHTAIQNVSSQGWGGNGLTANGLAVAAIINSSFYKNGNNGVNIASGGGWGSAQNISCVSCEIAENYNDGLVFTGFTMSLVNTITQHNNQSNHNPGYEINAGSTGLVISGGYAETNTGNTTILNWTGPGAVIGLDGPSPFPNTVIGSWKAGTYATGANCSSSASPAVCGAAAAGSVAIPTGVTSVTLTVNTTAVTANSQIALFSDDTLGTKLGVTCNSTLATLVGGMAVTARTAGTSFQTTYNGTIATNPLCVSYSIIN